MKGVSRCQELVTGGPEGCQGSCEGEDNVLHSPVTRADQGVVMCGRGVGFATWQWLALELFQS